MTLPETDPPEQPNEQANEPRCHEPAPRWAVKGAGAVAVGALLFTAGAVANHYIFEGQQQTPLTASMLEAELNGTGHVDAATVEVGYQIPLPDPAAENATAVLNPIKLGANMYAYVSAIDNNNGVRVKTVQYDGALPATDIGGHSKEYPHEVTTPLAEIYSNYVENAGTGETRRNYFVVMGTESGNIQDLTSIPEGGVESDSAQSIRTQQLGEITANTAGDLVGGK